MSASATSTTTEAEKLHKVQRDFESHLKPIDPWKAGTSDEVLRSEFVMVIVRDSPSKISPADSPVAEYLKGLLASQLQGFIAAQGNRKGEAWKQIKALGDLLIKVCCQKLDLGIFSAHRLLITLQMQQDVVDVAARHSGTIPDPGTIEVDCEIGDDGEVVRKITYQPGQAEFDTYDEIAYGLFDIFHGGGTDSGGLLHEEDSDKDFEEGDEEAHCE